MSFKDRLQATATHLQELSVNLQSISRKIQAIPTVHCPRCSSTNFDVVNKPTGHASRLAWFIATGLPIGPSVSTKTVAVCKDCGKHFKI